MPLGRLADEGRFLRDLMYRLAVLVPLPRLAEHAADIEEIVGALCAADGEEPPSFTPAAVRAMTGYDWPGNVRELYQVVRRLLMAQTGGPVDVDDVRPLLAGAAAGGGDATAAADAAGTALRRMDGKMVDRVERAVSAAVTQEHELHPSALETAKTLGMHHSGVTRRLRRGG